MKQWLLLIVVGALGAGCTGKVDTRVQSSGIASPVPQAYMISTVAETSPELRSAYKMVAAAMAKKGFTLVKEGALHLEITLDARPAELSLGSKDAPDSLSPAKEKKMLQSCADREYRLGVTLTKADGSEMYRGRAAEYHCKVTVSAALPNLVDAALADFGRPRGNYVITRSGRE